LSPEEVQRKIQAILARDEFRGALDREGREVEVIGELFRTLLSTIAALVGDLRANHPGLFLLTLAIGLVILGVAITLGARGAARRRAGSVRLAAEAPELLKGDPVQLRRDAKAAASEGRFLEATRLEFRAAVIEQALVEGSLERVEDAERFRRARTYRELIEEFAARPAAGSKFRAAPALARFRQVAERLELGLYGGAPLDRQDYDAAIALGERR
jgi:hypothetical protein